MHPSLVYQPPMTRTAALQVLNSGRTPITTRNVTSVVTLSASHAWRVIVVSGATAAGSDIESPYGAT